MRNIKLMKRKRSHDTVNRMEKCQPHQHLNKRPLLVMTSDVIPELQGHAKYPVGNSQVDHLTNA